jgi:hypothetical protein
MSSTDEQYASLGSIDLFKREIIEEIMHEETYEPWNDVSKPDPQKIELHQDQAHYAFRETIENYVPETRSGRLPGLRPPGIVSVEIVTRCFIFLSFRGRIRRRATGGNHGFAPLVD